MSLPGNPCSPANVFPFRFDPFCQFLRQIGSKRQCIPLAVLFVGSIESQAGEVSIENQLADRQGSEFVQSKPRQNQSLIDQCPFTTQTLHLLDDFRAQVGYGFPFLLSSTDRGCIEERSPSGHFQKFDQFLLGQGPTFPTAIRSVVGFGNIPEGVRQQSASSDAPIGKTDDCFPIAVSTSGRHPISLLIQQTAFKRFRPDLKICF